MLFKRILLIIALINLSGCALFGSNFECPRKQLGDCDSVSGVYEKIIKKKKETEVNK